MEEIYMCADDIYELAKGDPVTMCTGEGNDATVSISAQQLQTLRNDNAVRVTGAGGNDVMLYGPGYDA